MKKRDLLEILLKITGKYSRFNPDNRYRTAKKILNLINEWETTPSLFLRKDVYLRLNSMCLEYPLVVILLVFDEELNEDLRDHLLFRYSKDHGGSCTLSDNPRWSRMIKLMVPNMAMLPNKFQIILHWYQETHNIGV